jgi:hypothetical protein
MDAAPQIIAEIRSMADLHDAMRARFDALEISRLEIDAAAGLASGHAGKLLAPVPVRRFGDKTLWPVLETAGVKLCLVEDPDALARVTVKLKKRQRNAVRCVLASRRTINAARAAVLQELTSKGGTARMQKLGPDGRKQFAKSGAAARWSKARKRKP